VCRDNDQFSFNACHNFNDNNTATCTKAERDFLRKLLGGCSTPISALATIQNEEIHFRGNILSPDGKEKAEVEMTCSNLRAEEFGIKAAEQLLKNGGQSIANKIRNAGN
jgi:hydroxymethylbilane synthase